MLRGCRAHILESGHHPRELEWWAILDLCEAHIVSTTGRVGHLFGRMFSAGSEAEVNAAVAEIEAATTPEDEKKGGVQWPSDAVRGKAEFQAMQAAADDPNRLTDD